MIKTIFCFINKLTIIASHIFARLVTLYHRAGFKRFAGKSLILPPCKIEGHQFIDLGLRVRIMPYSWIMALPLVDAEPVLKIGDFSYIGNYSHIVAVKSVIIGNKVLVADRVYISDNYHGYEDINIPVIDQSVKFKGNVEIGDGSWIGENVCIIGAKVGKHCVIGANSVVTKDIPDYSVAAGSPAKVIKRFNQETQQWQKV